MPAAGDSGASPEGPPATRRGTLLHVPLRVFLRRAGPALGAAAALMLAVGLGVLNQPGTPSATPATEPATTPPPALAEALSGNAAPAADGFRPVAAQNFLRRSYEDDIVLINGGQLARKYRYEYIDTVTFRNEADGSTLEIKIPREETVVVPVTLL